jgi:hypothetical protein
MNPVALIIALPILKGLFNGGSVAVSPTITTPPPPPKDTGTVTLVTDVLTPKPISVTDKATGVVVPIRKISDTAQQIRDRIKYGSGL